MNVTRDYKGSAVSSGLTCKIPVVDLAANPALPAVEGSIVYDTSTETIVPYTGSQWASSVVVNPITPDLRMGNLIGCTKTNATWEYSEYSKTGNSVHVSLYDTLGDFSSTSNPQAFNFNLPFQTSVSQLICGSCSFSTPTGSCTGHCGVSASTYSTGTVSQNGTTVTGSGTTFVPYMIGGTITFSTGETAVVTAYNSATSLTVDTSQTVSSGTYSLAYSSGFVYMNGAVVAGSFPNSQLAADFTYLVF